MLELVQPCSKKGKCVEGSLVKMFTIIFSCFLEIINLFISTGLRSMKSIEFPETSWTNFGARTSAIFLSMYRRKVMFACDEYHTHYHHHHHLIFLGFPINSSWNTTCSEVHQKQKNHNKWGLQQISKTTESCCYCIKSIYMYLLFHWKWKQAQASKTYWERSK